MASSFHFLPFLSSIFFIIFFFFTSTSATSSFRPKSLLLPVTKDPSLQYVTQLRQRTPLLPLKLTVDLGGRFLWVDCNHSYASSTYKPARCRSAQCSLANSRTCGECFSPPKPGCNNHTCSHLPDNPIISLGTIGEVASDVVSLQSTDGSNPSRSVSVPNFLFVCGTTFLLEGLAGGVQGMAGFGRTGISLPAQFAASFSLKRKFALCLSSSTAAPGAIFFGGNGSYFLLPNVEISILIYTPLFINPVSTAGAFFEGDRSAEYFIGVKSILINEKTVPLNNSLLKIDSHGIGGTKISTVNPYTILESSIFNAVVKIFVEQLQAGRVAAMAPFGACFDSKNISSTRVGPAVPTIDLVLQSKKVVWRIFGANSMVAVNGDVLCLGLVDGGVKPRTSIVIGAHQIEDNLLEFDLASSRLGFTSTLLFQRTTCANFNFTSNA